MKKITFCLILMLALMIIPGVILATENVTEVGDAEALINAVKTSGTVKLINSIDLNERVLIDTGINITLDLNGQTLDLPTTEEYDNYGITVKGELIITGNGTVNVNGLYGIGTSVSGGSLTIKNGRFVGTNSDYILGSFGGKIVIEGGTFKGNYCVINAFVEYTGTAEVKGGIFNNIEETIVLGNTKVSGGTFNHEISKDYLVDGVICPNVYDEYVVVEDTQYNIIVKEVEGGKVVADKTKAQYGDTINLTVIINDGYAFKSIEVSDEGMGGILDTDSFLMIFGGDVTITPTFEKLTQTVEASKEVIIDEKTESMLVESLKEILNTNKELETLVNGNNIELEVLLSNSNVEAIEKETIEKSITSKVENIKIAKYLDISINVKIIDDTENGTVVDKLAQLKEKLNFSVEIPTDLPKVENGYSRTYYIVRNHNGVIEILDTKVSDDGKALNFESDKFSTYAIAYVDEKIEDKVEDKKEEKDETPKTGSFDITIHVSAMLVISTLAVISIKRKTGKHSK